MLPNSDHPPRPEPTPFKPKTPPLFDRKNSFRSLLQPYFSFHHHKLWLILSVLLLQIFLLICARSYPVSTPVTSGTKLFPPSATPSLPPNASQVSISSTDSLTGLSSAADTECPFGKVYVYELPPVFNSEIVQNCHDLNPWTSRCEALSNDGLGKTATGISRIMPESLARSWYWTDQFALEVIFHNRMMNYRCRTSEPQSARAFYIPFYAGLAVGKFLWTDNYTAEDRDRHCKLLLKWLEDQPAFNRSKGWDHFMTLGRITWDFRRSKDHDWGSSCIYFPGMHNITRLLIERNPWDPFDVGVPYPTGFHPSSSSDMKEWQDFVRNRPRKALYCFAGAPRASFKNDFRGILLSQCSNDSESCRAVDCAGSKCSNGTWEILETFLDSDFCLQPRGDSFTRRSTFDCMIAGSIPVFFWKRTAYYQYQWFLPDDSESYSVFIDRNEVKNGASIKAVLDKIGKDKVKRMREKVIDYLPKIVYSKPREGIAGSKDAFDTAVEGVLKRIEEQKGWYNW